MSSENQTKETKHKKILKHKKLITVITLITVVFSAYCIHSIYKQEIKWCELVIQPYSNMAVLETHSVNSFIYSIHHVDIGCHIVVSGTKQMLGVCQIPDLSDDVLIFRPDESSYELTTVKQEFTISYYISVITNVTQVGTYERSMTIIDVEGNEITKNIIVFVEGLLNVSSYGSGTVYDVQTATVLIAENRDDGYIFGWSDSYETARTIGYCEDSLYYFSAIGQDFVGDYTVYRSYLKFDTTTIPSDATLLSATLQIYGFLYAGVSDWNMTMQKWTGDVPLGLNDYNNFDGINYGSLSMSSWNDYSWNTITIQNFDLIQKVGNTNICLRSSDDISGIAPVGDEHTIIYAQEDDTSKSARLVIKYYITEAEDTKPYLVNSIPTLIATPTDNFLYWILDDAIIYDNPITVTMNQDHTLKAYFNPTK